MAKIKKQKQKQITIIVILLVAVVGLSIGFSAFSGVISIKSSATVKPSSTNFSVKFSSSNTALETNQITPTVSGATGDKATINNDGTNPSITGLKANFSAPNQSATYTFYVHNVGEYEAFLKSITYKNVSGNSTPKVCTKTDATATDSLVTAACNAINLTIQVGSQSTDKTLTGITGHNLAAKTGKETVVVTITYAAGGQRADGDFNVEFGDIELSYSSTDA